MPYFLLGNSITKPLSEHYAQHLDIAESPEASEFIIVFGGDGSMLHAIAKYQHLNKPFIGVHAGTRGYLMNNVENPQQLLECIDSVELESLCLLEAQITTTEKSSLVYSFNDTWVSRETGQTLRMSVSIDDIIQPAMIVGDGMLFCTPQGSTGYNLALRGKAISPNVPVLQITPISCVVNKSPLGSVILADSSVVKVEFHDIVKRPGLAFHDGKLHSKAPVREITVKKSNKFVRLGFIQNYSFRSKVAAWQFNT